MLVGSLCAVVYVSFWMFPLLLLALLCNAYYWIRVKEHFERGATNPGIVIAVNPTLVAVATDLTHGVGSYPAVKVFRTRLRKIMGEKAQPGMHLPTVSLYTRADDPTIPHWVDFNPVPIECGTSDARAIDRINASLDAEDWQRLDTYVPLLPSTAPGLYRFDAPPPATTNHFVFAKIADTVSPMERRRKYVTPLDEALQAAGLGRTTGGGTMLDRSGAIKWIGIDIELTNLQEGIDFTRRKLAELGAPPGSL